MKLKNIFSHSSASLDEEFIEDILKTDTFRVERIISQGHASPENFWYDQSENEFVLLLSGSAVIEMKDGDLVSLRTGDYLIIPKHTLHRVQSTDDREKTFWLTIFYP